MTPQLIKDGSIVATLGNELFEEKTVFLLVMDRGRVIDQVRLHRGVCFHQDFVGMTVQDLVDWVEDDQSFSPFPEERTLINSFDETRKEVKGDVIRNLDGAIQVWRPRQAGHNC